MSTIYILGIDLGQHRFYLVGNNYSGKEVIRRKFNRSQLLRFYLFLNRRPYLLKLWWCSLAS